MLLHAPALTVQQLILLRQFAVIILRLSAIRCRPVLHHIPVGTIPPLHVVITRMLRAVGSISRMMLLHSSAKSLGSTLSFAVPTSQPTRGFAPFTHWRSNFLKFSRNSGVSYHVGRQLSPEQNTFFIPIPLIVEVVRLVRITESIEARSLHLLTRAATCSLLKALLPKLVLVLACPVQDTGFVVPDKTSVTVVVSPAS